MDITNKTDGEVTAEKVANALNASTEAKEISKEVLKSSQETSQSLKSVAESLDTLTKLTVKSEEDKKAKEEAEEVELIKELKSEIALINSKISAGNSGQIQGSSNRMVEKSQKFLKQFSDNVTNKSLTKHDSIENKDENSLFDSCGVFVGKSLRTFDNSNAGAEVPEKRILGTIDINLQTVSPITSIVNNISAGSIVAGALGYKTYDESAVDIFESGEMVGKQETPNTVKGNVDIYVTMNAAKVRISDKTLHSVSGGEMAVNPLLREFMAIERKYEKNIAKQILNGKNELGIYGIFSTAQQSGSKIKVVETENLEKVTLKDISSLGSNLKGDYLRGAAVLIDRRALYELFYDEASDGHLKLEQIDYINGLAALRTPEGIIPLIGVDSSFLVADIKDNNGFGNYTPFAGVVPGSQITGYTPSMYSGVPDATVNKGKVVAILANFGLGYSLARSSVVQTGVDNSFGNLLENGYVYGGKIGYVGGKTTIQESIALLYIR